MKEENLKNSNSILNQSTIDQTKAIMNDKFSMMIEFFLEDTNTYINTIEEGVKIKNVEMIIAPSHTIKSSASQLGADKLSILAKEMEQLSINIYEGKSSDFERIVILFEDLKYAFLEVEPEFKKFL